MPFFTCSWCNKDTFKSKRGLTNHQLHHCQYNPTKSSQPTADPSPQPPEAAKARADPSSSSSSRSNRDNDDDGSVSVDLAELAGASTDADVKERRYSSLAQRFEEEEGWTDAESVAEAALFPLEVDDLEDDEAGYGTPDDDDNAQVPEQEQELRDLLQQAEVASPTTRAKSRSYREEAKQVPRRSNLGFEVKQILMMLPQQTMVNRKVKLLLLKQKNHQSQQKVQQLMELRRRWKMRQQGMTFCSHMTTVMTQVRWTKRHHLPRKMTTALRLRAAMAQLH